MSLRSFLWNTGRKLDIVEEFDMEEADFVWELSSAKKGNVMRITETGCCTAYPDKICVVVSMRGKVFAADYKEASEMADKDTEALLELLESLQISRDQAESKELEIALSRKDEDDEAYVQGYTYRHLVEITISADSNILCELIRTLRQSNLCLSLEYEYKVSFKDNARNEALADGTRKCIRKAQLLAKELGITLSGIRRVCHEDAHADMDVLRGKHRLIPRMYDERNCRLSDRMTDVSRYISCLPEVCFKEEITVEWFVEDVREVRHE